ncbi:hypothetical protein Btru_027848 [Bulinus truncatus]|nr:hypothetical protein Btru_027848 [Bulinus truncatus]
MTRKMWKMLLSVFTLSAILTASQAITADVLTSQVQKTFLDAHNSARAIVGVLALKWNNTLATFAATKTPGTSCTFQHSGGPYGENLFASSPLNNNNTVVSIAAVKLWVDEKDYVDVSWTCITIFSTKTCGHYSQRSAAGGQQRQVSSGWSAAPGPETILIVKVYDYNR